MSFYIYIRSSSILIKELSPKSSRQRLLVYIQLPFCTNPNIFNPDKILSHSGRYKFSLKPSRNGMWYEKLVCMKQKCLYYNYLRFLYSKNILLCQRIIFVEISFSILSARNFPEVHEINKTASK